MENISSEDYMEERLSFWMEGVMLPSIALPGVVGTIRI